jgi:hypothetical protein
MERIELPLPGPKPGALPLRDIPWGFRILVVDRLGFEPRSFSLQGSCSGQLELVPHPATFARG